jgi:hypothetical protein
VTPDPTSSTVPAMSSPSTAGRDCFAWVAYLHGSSYQEDSRRSPQCAPGPHWAAGIGWVLLIR